MCVSITIYVEFKIPIISTPRSRYDCFIISFILRRVCIFCWHSLGIVWLSEWEALLGIWCNLILKYESHKIWVQDSVLRTKEYHKTLPESRFFLTRIISVLEVITPRQWRRYRNKQCGSAEFFPIVINIIFFISLSTYLLFIRFHQCLLICNV